MAGTLALLHALRRRWRCDWPVEVFYLGSDEAFAPTVAAQLLAFGNVTLRDVSSTEAARWVRSVSWQPALLASSLLAISRVSPSAGG